MTNLIFGVDKNGGPTKSPLFTDAQVGQMNQAPGTAGAVTVDADGQTLRGPGGVVTSVSTGGNSTPTIAKLLQMLALTGAVGTIYYVSSTGNDSADGLTQATAWATVAKVNASNFAPGDAVLFEGGKTFAGTTLTPASGGSPTGNLYFGSYGTGKATISTPAGRGAYVLNKRNITLDNLIFDGGVSASNGYDGVYVENTVAGTRKPGVKLFGLEVMGYGHCGIQCWGSHPTKANGFSGLTIDGCYVHDCTANCSDYEGGITTWGLYGQATYGYSNIGTTIRNCIVTACSGKVGKVVSGNGITVDSDCNALIEYCYANGNGGNGTGSVAIWFADCINSTIQFCEAAFQHTGNTQDGDGFDLDDGCVGCVIQYCYAHDNDGVGVLVYQPAPSGTYIAANNTVRYCVIANNNRKLTTAVKGEIVIGNTSSSLMQGIRVHNNTVYSSYSTAGALTIYGTNITSAGLLANVHNNLFYTASASQWNIYTTGNPTGVTIAGNAYWAPSNAVRFSWNGSTYTSCAAFRTGTSQETISAAAAYTNTDPLLPSIASALTTAGYKPNLMGQFKSGVGSPLRGTAKDIAALYSIDAGQFDFFGGGLPASSRDIGAFQA